MTRGYRVLTGPTASGKTNWLAHRGASRKLSVLSADSRQVFLHMDIGTGKSDVLPSGNVTHYGLDLIVPTKNFSVYQYLSLAAHALESAFLATESSNDEIWICGGTGLYIRAVVEGLPLGASPRPRLREALAARIEERGSRIVAQELGLDVRDPDNPVRVIRMAEDACTEPQRASAIYEYAGLSEVAPEDDIEEAEASYEDARRLLADWNCLGIYVLDPGIEELGRRIEARVRWMFEHGLLEEVRKLRDLGFGEARVVLDGIAYREAGMVLDDILSQEDAIELAVTRTRQYAKRQRTYFRGMGWISYTQDELDTKFADAGRAV